MHASSLVAVEAWTPVCNLQLRLEDAAETASSSVVSLWLTEVPKNCELTLRKQAIFPIHVPFG